MSNNQVHDLKGSVYQRIIDEVISQCRQPFEEEGTASQVLEDFKKAWQARISERKVADMPWDPKPPPPAPVAQAPPQPRLAPPVYLPQPQAIHQSSPNPDVKVKVEQNDLAALPSMTPHYTHANPGLAAANASQAIRDRFGDAGAASIQQIHASNHNAPHGVKRPAPQGSPTSEDVDVKRRITEYQHQSTAHAQHSMQQLQAAQRNPQPPVGAAQTDGAADWKQLVAERRALAAEGSAAADMTIAERVAAMQRAEEGNGVMQPHSFQANRRAHEVSASSRSTTAGSAGFDGVDDDDDDEEKPDIDDADAINSDLDDDEEENLEDEDEERSSELMVCTYEKVARVKNKWKCTLKDGILITGGKEYVFGKATGEFEW